MPKYKSAKSLHDLCAEAVAANLANVSLDSFSAPGDPQNDELNNPFETLRNIAKCYNQQIIIT